MEGNVLHMLVYFIKDHEQLSSFFQICSEKVLICSLEAEGARMHITILNSWLVIPF